MHSVLWLNKNSKRLAPEKNPHLSTQATTVHKFYLPYLACVLPPPPLKQNRASLRRGEDGFAQANFFSWKVRRALLTIPREFPGLITHFFFQNIARVLLRPVNVRNDNDMGSALRGLHRLTFTEAEEKPQGKTHGKYLSLRESSRLPFLLSVVHNHPGSDSDKQQPANNIQTWYRNTRQKAIN